MECDLICKMCIPFMISYNSHLCKTVATAPAGPILNSRHCCMQEPEQYEDTFFLMFT